MISRRKMLEGGALTALALALPFGRLRRVFASVPTTFDYYISADGDDNNPGTLAAPWSITALNNNQSTYSGKAIGIIGNTSTSPTLVQYGTKGGVRTTLYSLYQGLNSSNLGNLQVLGINGGSTVSPTILATCDANGQYSPRTAIIDCSDPSTGNLPTVAGGVIGQTQTYTIVPNYGYVTIDGLVIRNFTFSALAFAPTASVGLGIVIQNCEIYNQQNIVSNNNPGAIWFDTVSNAVVTNCFIHDLKSNASGTANPTNALGIIQFNSSGTTISNCTFYNCPAISNKDHWQSMEVSYCYCGWGTFGSPYSGDQKYFPGTIENYLCDTGETVSFHHNILLGPLQAAGEGTAANKGTVKIYNNTFYKPAGIGGANMGLGVFSDYNSSNVLGGTGTFEFFNNLAYAEDGNYRNVPSMPASFTKMGASVGGTWSTLSNCNYNAYGSGMTFAQDWNGLIPLSTWQTYGYDKNSTILTASPFSGSPSEADYSTFAISGPAATAGQGGAACGAVDGSGPVGCDFVTLPRPSASVLSSS